MKLPPKCPKDYLIIQFIMGSCCLEVPLTQRVPKIQVGMHLEELCWGLEASRLVSNPCAIWVLPSSELHPWKAGSSCALGSSSLPGYQTHMSHSHRRTESNNIFPPNPI